MTLENLDGSKWRSLLAALVLTLATTALAGCMGDGGEEAGPGDDDGGLVDDDDGNGTGDGTDDGGGPLAPWEESFVIPEDTEMAWLNLTITGVDDASGRFTACVFNPEGELVARASGDVGTTEMPGAANFTFSEGGAADAGGNATGEEECDLGGEAAAGAEGNATAEIVAGKWRYEVVSDAQIVVATEVGYYTPVAAEA